MNATAVTAGTTPWGLLALLGLALLVGSFIQSTVGFGINVVAGPVVLLAAPDLMPGALVLGGFLLPILQVSRSVRILPTIRNSLLAGALSGVSGSSAAVGGPFTALLFQNEPPDRLRDTLAVSFVTGSALSTAGLAFGGQLHAVDLLAALVWAPFVVLGYAAAIPVRGRLDATTLRRAVLAFCVVAALVILVRAMV